MTDDRESLWRRLFGSLPERNPSLELNRATRKPRGVRYFGVDLPTASRVFPPDMHTIRAQKFPTSSLDWSGSDWDSPVGLTFQAVTLDAVTLGFTAALPDDPEGFAHAARRALEHGVRDTARALQQSDRVIDPTGLTVEADRFQGVNGLRMVGRAWPTMEGVTVPARDTTL